jgi:hypothetical protein
MSAEERDTETPRPKTYGEARLAGQGSPYEAKPGTTYDSLLKGDTPETGGQDDDHA